MPFYFRRRVGGARFVHPVDPTPRTAILAPGFEETKLVRVFPAGWSEEAARFAPSSIAGPPEQLRRLAGHKLELRHAVVAFTYDGRAELSEDDRDLFWEVFGVPVFEERLGANNELLAMECEAHAGLHLIGDFGSLGLDLGSCACGNPAPRVPKLSGIDALVSLLP